MTSPSGDGRRSRSRSRRGGERRGDLERERLRDLIGESSRTGDRARLLSSSSSSSSEASIASSGSRFGLLSSSDIARDGSGSGERVRRRRGVVTRRRPAARSEHWWRPELTFPREPLTACTGVPSVYTLMTIYRRRPTSPLSPLPRRSLARRRTRTRSRAEAKSTARTSSATRASEARSAPLSRPDPTPRSPRSRGISRTDL
jgi:hypothetical protein